MNAVLINTKIVFTVVYEAFFSVLIFVKKIIYPSYSRALQYMSIQTFIMQFSWLIHFHVSNYHKHYFVGATALSSLLMTRGNQLLKEIIIKSKHLN